MLHHASTIDILIPVITSLTAGFLGLVIYLRNPSSWTNRIFSLLALNVVIYAPIHFLTFFPPVGTPHNQLFWIRVDMAVGAFLGPLLLLLVYNFPKKDFIMPRKYLYPLLGLLFITVVACLTPFVFSGIEYPNGPPPAPPLPTPAPGIILYFIDFLGLILLSFILITIKYRKAEGREKTRIGYFLYGILGTFSILVILTFILVIIFKISAGVFLGPPSFLILVLFLAYAIARHHFLDIRPIIVRAASFFVLFAIAALIYNIILTLFIREVSDIESSWRLFIGGTALALLAFSSFPVLEKLMRRITDRIFFKGQYDSEKLLSELTTTMAENIELKPMLNKTLHLLTRHMRISKALFAIVEDHKVTDIHGVGYKTYSFRALALDKFFNQRQQAENMIFFDELQDKELKDLFRDFDISIVIPLRVKKEEVAVLVLGPKSSGESYNKKDAELLDIFSQQAAITIQNSKNYEALKRFNVKLENMVEERTKELKESQQRELEKAKELSRLKDNFLNMTAHELRGPLMPISTQVQLLLDDAFGKLTKAQVKSLKMINRNLDSLEKLTGDLLDITRIKTKKLKIEPKKTNLKKVIEQSVENYKEKAKEENIDLSLEVKNIPEVYADPVRMLQVFNDLLNNAFKFTDENGKIKVIAEEMSNGELILVQVKDTGSGIAKKDLEKIFEPFVQADPPMTRRAGGIGLGLVIVRGIIEQHGGRIWAESGGKGKGATFKFILPVNKLKK